MRRPSRLIHPYHAIPNGGGGRSSSISATSGWNCFRFPRLCGRLNESVSIAGLSSWITLRGDLLHKAVTDMIFRAAGIAFVHPGPFRRILTAFQRICHLVEVAKPILPACFLADSFPRSAKPLHFFAPSAALLKFRVNLLRPSHLVDTTPSFQVLPLALRQSFSRPDHSAACPPHKNQPLAKRLRMRCPSQHKTALVVPQNQPFSALDHDCTTVRADTHHFVFHKCTRFFSRLRWSLPSEEISLTSVINFSPSTKRLMDRHQKSGKR